MKFEAIATDYIIQAFEQYGVEAKGDDGTFLQAFTMTALNQPHASDYTDGELRIANNIVGWILAVLTQITLLTELITTT